MKKPHWWVVIAVLIVCAGALLYSWLTSGPKVTATTTIPVPAAAPAIANPVPPQAAGTPALPSIDDSDGPVHDAIAAIASAQSLDSLLNPKDLVRHIVATVDNLPRSRVAVDMRPVRPVPGKFLANGDNQQATIAPENYARYTPYVKLLQMLDTKQFAATYFHLYPLFQQAYQDLGYPDGYFNDRLIQAIDNLLATPDVTGPIQLVRPNVMYEYADPKLEQLSAGQKLMLRIGADNAAAVKAKLRELRAVLATRPDAAAATAPAAPAPAATPAPASPGSP